MSYRVDPLSVVHQSDAACLRRVEFERSNPQPSGLFAVVGTRAHEALERYTIESAQGSADPAVIVRDVLAEHLVEDDPAVAEHVIAIMARAFESADKMRLGLPPSPWTVTTEWLWALDAELQPVERCGRCGGTTPEELAPPCPGCAAHPGWSRPIAHSGTVDRLDMNLRAGLLVVKDWKSQLQMESSADVATDRQARRYAFAVLRHFPDARMVKFEKVFLRHGYAGWHEFRRSDPWFADEAGRMRRIHARRLLAIETGEFPEMPGDDCHFCPLYWTRCAEMKRRREIGVDPSEQIEVQANVFLALRYGVGDLDRRLRAHVAASGEPISLNDDDGTVLGKKPVRAYELARDYDMLLNQLEGLGMTREQRAEWFTWLRRGDAPGRVKKALEELVGARHAKALIDAGGWLDEMTVEEFGTHRPPARVARAGPMSLEELDAAIDRAFGGA